MTKLAYFVLKPLRKVLNPVKEASWNNFEKRLDEEIIGNFYDFMPWNFENHPDFLFEYVHSIYLKLWYSVLIKSNLHINFTHIRRVR